MVHLASAETVAHMSLLMSLGIWIYLGYRAFRAHRSFKQDSNNLHEMTKKLMMLQDEVIADRIRLNLERARFNSERSNAYGNKKSAPYVSPKNRKRAEKLTNLSKNNDNPHEAKLAADMARKLRGIRK